jgi:hypothetical protein
MTFHSFFVGGLLLRLPAKSTAQNKSAHPKGTPITMPINNEIIPFIIPSYNAAVAIYVTYSHSFSFAALVAEFLIWNSAVLASLIFAASTWHDATLAPLEVALSISNPLIAIGVYPAFAIENSMLMWMILQSSCCQPTSCRCEQRICSGHISSHRRNTAVRSEFAVSALCVGIRLIVLIRDIA